MLRWGVALILLGLFVACFFSGNAGGQIIDVGKWVLGVALVLYVLVLVLGGLGGPRGGPTGYGPI